MSVQLSVKVFSDVGCIISHGSHSVSDTTVLFKFFFLLSSNPLYYPGQLSSSSTWTSFYCLKKADRVTWVLPAGLSWHSLSSGLLGRLSSFDLRLLITLGLHLSLPVCSFSTGSSFFARLYSSEWPLTSHKWAYKTEGCNQHIQKRIHVHTTLKWCFPAYFFYISENRNYIPRKLACKGNNLPVSWQISVL